MNEREARRIVEQEFEVDISTRSRKWIYVAARSVYYHICIKYGDKLTYDVFTGEINYSHSTVINAMSVFNDMLETKQWLHYEELRICEDRAILLSFNSDVKRVKAFASIEEVNKKFKRDLYLMVADYTKVISAYESKIKKQKLELLKTRLDYEE